MRLGNAISKISLLLLLAASILAGLNITLDIAISDNENISSDGNLEYSTIIETINMTNIREHVAMLESFNSRVPGYHGSYLTTDYIMDTLTEYLPPDQVYLENLTVVTPITYEANITILSPERSYVQAYALWPNLIETCETNSTGVSGNLIHNAQGDFVDFNDKKVSGNIVVMDFDSGNRWIDAVMLGAKGIIFTEPEDTTTEVAEEKNIDLPLDVPRLYVKKDEAEFLEELVKSNDEVRVRITLRMRYENKQTSNVIAFVEGSDPELKNQIIIVSTHHDSISIIPSLAPGAEEAIGTAALLELARILSIHQPKRSVMLVALSGHNLALAGARDFIDKHFQDIGGKIKLLMNLDLSTETDSIVALWIGQFYRFDLNPGRFLWVSQHITEDYMPKLIQLDQKYEDKFFNALDVASWRRFIPRRFVLDSEPFTMAGGLGFSYVTGHSWRRYWNTPLDTFDRLKFENLKPQLDIIFCTLYSFTEESEIPQHNPTHFDPRGGGFLTLRGRVVEYNIEKGWYDPVPNALVLLQGKPETLLYRHETVLISDANGTFVFKGALQSVVQGVMYATRFYTANAYVDNPSSGPVEFATDYGKYTPMFTGQITIDKPDNHISIGVFNCGSIAIFKCINPFTMNEILASFQVNDVRTHSPPDSWGLASNMREAVIFVSPGLSAEIIMEKPGGGQFLGVLNNASETDPYGTGYKVNSGRCIYLTETPIHFASTLIQLTDRYLEKSKSQGLRPTGVEENNQKASEYISQAYTALNDQQYDIFYSKTLKAWSLGVQAYHEIRGFMSDTINTTVFFFVLLIPFAFLSERLFLEYSEGRKRLIASAVIFGIFVAILYVVHPGFHLAANIYMTLMG
ncbi:MAG: M28 family peptidase, partial [Candidatus Bathyarchaeota archaeon]